VRFLHQSVIAAAPEAVFAFHERPDALARLVPPWERVEVLQPPASLQPGTRVVLRMRIGPFPMTWVAEHTLYEKDRLFQDRMVRGPFRRWVHTHRFVPHAAGTLLRDEVELDLPLLTFAGAPLVRRRLRKMFEYRHGVTARAVGVREN
jgi:ligand-binding SRPBCC domain-containing protein